MDNFDSKPKVLIVDDEPKNLKILRLRLQEDFDLREAASAEEAMNILTTFVPSVIVSDIMMPGMNGYQLARHIRSKSVYQFIKIILVSGRAMIEDKLEGYSSGANDYVTKPFDGNEIKAKLITYTRLHDLEKQLFDLNSTLEEQVRIRSEQLLKAERLAFVGRHSSEIVHNLKNPLTVQVAHLARLEKRYPDDESVKAIGRATKRVLHIVEDILIANGEIKEVKEAVDINSIVQSEIEFLKIGFSNKQEISQSIDLRAGNQILASSSHLHQVVGNVIKNAFESMHGMPKGKIEICTENVKQGVKLVVSDTGVGMSPDTLAKAFDPHFTTKTGADGGPVGNGLGLSYCKKMIESYGGNIVIESELGKGTRQIIYFPAA